MIDCQASLPQSLKASLFGYISKSESENHSEPDPYSKE
jgi:hypothetical protein